MKAGWIAAGAAGAAVLGLYLNNASWLAPAPSSGVYLVSHRGVHQTFPSGGIGAQDCTATMIHPSRHSFIENTIPAIAAAFGAGAEIVEIDIHPTTDGEFAVFHDWTLDCRTEGSGVTRAQSMDYIRTLDAGYGYTADGGQTYPLRGTGVGLIPTLGEVLDAFPGGRFILNFKSNTAAEGDLLTDYLAARDEDLSRIMVYGGDNPTARFMERNPEVRGFSRATAKTCLLAYLATGWTGRAPAACERQIVPVPPEYSWAVWGWPRRFQQRMADAGSEVWLWGDIDTRAELAPVPADFAGGVRTNRIEDLAE